MRYARIENGLIAEFREFGVVPDPNPAKGLDWRPAPEAARPGFDSSTQTLEGPNRTVLPDKVIESYVIRPLTPQELSDRQQSADIAALQGAAAEIAGILISHIDAHLAKGNIAASDFDAGTRQRYQAFKACVDRLKAAS